MALLIFLGLLIFVILGIFVFILLLKRNLLKIVFFLEQKSDDLIPARPRNKYD